MGLGLWSFLGYRRANPRLIEASPYDKEAMKSAMRGEVFVFESHRLWEFAYANKISMGDWVQMIHF